MSQWSAAQRTVGVDAGGSEWRGFQALLSASEGHEHDSLGRGERAGGQSKVYCWYERRVLDVPSKAVVTALPIL
jgi:hypothetical protein